MLDRKQALSRRPRVVDINLLPQEYQQRFRLSWQVLLVILAVILIGAAFIVNQRWTQAVEKVADLEVKVEAEKRELSDWRNQDTQAAELQNQLQQVKDKLGTMSSDYIVFLQQRMTWHEVLGKIIDFPGVSLNEVSNSPGSQQITVQGVAPDANTVADYGIYLKNATDSKGSKIFSSVSSPQMTLKGGSYSFSFILEARSGT